jgi:hypothetical protein
MLRTTNPEAAQEAEAVDRDRRRPYVSQSVVFHPRSGEGRSGKFQTAAIVTEIVDDDSVDLLIIWDADDFITRRRVPRRTDQNNVNAWTFNEYDEVHYHPEQKNLRSWKDLDVLFKRLADVDAQVAQLSEHVKHLRRTPKKIEKD